MTETDVDGTIGSLLAGRFRLTRLLGRGGMASVYRAEDESLGRLVAIKVFPRELADGDDLQRQRDEIQVLAALNHPSLVTLFDASTDDDGNAFLVMELVDGTDLHSRLHGGPLRPGEVAIIGRNLADALAYVHAQGIIHRDIKPGNILLPERDTEHSGPEAKLADFGIARIIDGARLTATGTVLGTAGYFSPEQALGEAITPASDIYSLGLVLLECLTGEREFPGTAVESMTTRLTRDPDVPSSLGDSWVGLLRGMTNRNPDARPTARDVTGVLARLAAQADVTQPDVTQPDATLPYPQATARTEVFAAAPSAPAARTDAPPLEPAGVPGAPARVPSRPRRLLVIVASVAAAVVLAWLATMVVSSFVPEARVDTPIEYPAVDGTLGAHLEQLQRSVEP